MIDKGFAYESAGDVYFDVSKAAEYGKLSHRDPEDLLAGARIEPSSLKRHPGDFALWKTLEARRAVVGQPLGARAAGLAHRVLGHEHEVPGRALRHPRRRPRPGLPPPRERAGPVRVLYRASRSPRTGCTTACLTKEGKKISKSDPGTIVLMSDLLKAHPPDTLRALLLSSHYRRPIDFGPNRLDEIERGLQTFYRAFERFTELTGERFDQLAAPTRRGEFDPGGSPLLAEIAEHRQQFLDAMDDDFNTGGAIGELFEVVHALNRFANQLTPDSGVEGQAARRVSRGHGRAQGAEPDPGPVPAASRAGVKPRGDALTAPLIGLLIDLRARLRKEKNFALADEIRNRLPSSA